MGMSASQARLLTLTSRQNDIEMKMQQMANTKMRLSSDSDAISSKYVDALNAQTLQMNKGGTGAVTTTLSNFYQNTNGTPMVMKNAMGQMVVTESVKKAMEASLGAYNSGHTMYYHQNCNIEGTAGYGKLLTQEQSDATRVANSEAVFMLQMTTGVNTYAEAGATNADSSLIENGQASSTDIAYYKALFTGLMQQATPTGNVVTDNFNKDTSLDAFRESLVAKGASGNGIGAAMNNFYNSGDCQANTAVTSQELALNNMVVISDSLANNPTWLAEQVQSGNLIIEGYNTTTNEWSDVSTTSNSNFTYEDDKANWAKAEAEYDSETSKINKKEKKIDMELKSLETEHSAVKTESDSVKSLISKNIEKSFQMFS